MTAASRAPSAGKDRLTRAGANRRTLQRSTGLLGDDDGSYQPPHDRGHSEAIAPPVPTADLGTVSEPPADPLSRIESMVEIINIARAVIYTQHRLLIDLGRDDAHGKGLLSEFVRVVFTDTPAATRGARALAERWGEQQLLDPPSAPATLALLDEAIKDAEARLGRLLARQEQIAAELRLLAEDPGAEPGD